MPKASCTWSPRRGWGPSPRARFWLRENAMSTTPARTTMVTSAGHNIELLLRLETLRPPPLRAMRWTFLVDDALPMTVRHLSEGAGPNRTAPTPLQGGGGALADRSLHAGDGGPEGQGGCDG